MLFAFYFFIYIYTFIYFHKQGKNNDNDNVNGEFICSLASIVHFDFVVTLKAMCKDCKPAICMLLPTSSVNKVLLFNIGLFISVNLWQKYLFVLMAGVFGETCVKTLLFCRSVAQLVHILASMLLLMIVIINC